jgi:hypothetical protein
MDPEGMLKGRMAETLVEELLRKSGNTIYRFGYEAILQNLTQIEKSFNGIGEAGNRIRAIPDFIVLDKEGNSTFLEVKFRWNGQLHELDHERLVRIKDFWNAKIIFVNCSQKPYFKISYPPYFDNEGQFRSRPLTEETEWRIDPNAYQKSEDLVEKYLTPTLIKNVMI